MKKVHVKIVNGQEAYLKNDLEGCVIRFEPGKGYWVKFPGKLAYKVAGDTAIITDALLEGIEITKEEYARF